MSIELFLKKKQNPAQCKNTADLLGWFGLVLALQKDYTVSTGWQILLLVSLGCALWFFAVYIVGLHGKKIRKGTLFHRLSWRHSDFYSLVPAFIVVSAARCCCRKLCAVDVFGIFGRY